MRFIILELIAIARDVGVALFELALRRAPRRYEHTMFVRAPRDIVWSVASARNITFEGRPPIVIRSLAPPQDGIEVLEVRRGRRTFRVALRALERREGVGEICALVPEHTDHLAQATGITTTGFGLVDAIGGTELTIFREGWRVPLRARINMPRTLRLMGRRIAAASEQAADLRRRPRSVASAAVAR